MIVSFLIPQESLSFMEPKNLWFLLLLPILVAFYLALLVVRSASLKRPERTNLTRLLPVERRWKKHLAVLMATVSLAALIMAYARPKGEELEPRDRATVIIVMDVSKSMMANDVQPTRIKAAKDSAKEFIDLMPSGFNVALVQFAASASMLNAPTKDHDRVKATIDQLELAASTAIGEGIYTGLDAMSLVPPDPQHPKDPPPCAMVLLSDGASNMGRSSDKAAEKAKQAKCPIYSIAYGTDRGVIVENGKSQPVRVDYAELQRIATLSGGKRFDADSRNALKDAYSKIGQSVGYQKVDKEITGRFILWGLLSAAIASLGVISIAARWP